MTFNKKNGYELSHLYKSGNYVRTPSGYTFRWSKMKTGSLVHPTCTSKIQMCHIWTIILRPDARITQYENDNTTTTRDITTIMWTLVMALHNVWSFFLLWAVHLDELEPTDERLKTFWEVMTNFSNEDRSKFLRFVTGRKRLPCPLYISPNKT